jgi:GntR family transcriptional regulator, transcriptional repressor for pyruvate dehydrogenase complex
VHPSGTANVVRIEILKQPRQSAKTGEVVAAAIRRRIANGELVVGDRLQSEEEMTESLGVARTTLREALRVLESQGLITIKRGRGGGPIVTMPELDRLAEPLAVVLQLRETTTTDLDAARALIEPNLAGWLAAKHTDDDLAALSAAATAAQVAADKDDRVAFGRAAALVHETLLLRSGNNTLSVISQLLHRIVLERYVHAAADSPPSLMRRAAKSYAKLVRLIAAGEADAAKAHWEKQMRWMATAGADVPLDILDAD